MPELSQPIAAGRIAEIYPWDEGQVLKLFRSQFPRDWVDYEARVTTAVFTAGARGPAVLGKLEVGGRYGILLERIQGVSMLGMIPRNPLRIGKYGQMMAELQAGIHACSAEGLPDLRDRLTQAIQQAECLSANQRVAALRALDALPAGGSLCHMDFHPDNILLTPTGPRIIDWMTVCSGNRWADVARTTLMLTIGDPPPGTRYPQILVFAREWLRRSYLKRYLALYPDTSGELEAWMPVLAATRLSDHIPGEEEKLLAYVQRLF